MAIDVAGYLAEQQRAAAGSGQGGELVQQWVTLEQLYNKKLWHQVRYGLYKFGHVRLRNFFLKFVRNPTYVYYLMKKHEIDIYSLCVVCVFICVAWPMVS